MAAKDDDIQGLQQDIEIASLMLRLIDYSARYEINIQLWPEYNTIYVAKTGIDMFNYGAHDLKTVLVRVLEYLDRVNRKQKPTNGEAEKQSEV